MKSTHKCLKEWNATIEALGQGKQTILIRRYATTLDGFLLYPTSSYAHRKNYLDSFQSKYHSFVKSNSVPEKDGEKTPIKYYAKIEKIVEKPSSSVSRLQKSYIWTSKHVKDYLNNNKAKIWVLRVYKLKKHYMVEPTPGAITYVNLNDEISLESIKPILSEREFCKIMENL